MSTSPNTSNYLLGKGKVYVDLLTAAGVRTGEIDVGNCTAFTVTPTVESLDHFESMGGIREKDKSVDTSVAMLAKWNTDEYSLRNLMLGVLSTVERTYAQATGHQINFPIVARVEKWMKLGEFRNVHNVVVTNTAGTTTYVLGTDYNLDAAIGRIFTIDGGSISGGQTIHVDFNYDATTYDGIYVADSSTIEIFLRFVGNPAVGPVWEGEFWKARLKPAGDLGFISEEWSGMDFEAEILKDVINYPTMPWGRMIDKTTNDAATS